MYNLVFTRRYCMGHRLRHGERKCSIPHGHNEYVRVTFAPDSLKAPLDGRANVVTPFAAAKRRWHAWIDDHVDHALQLGADDPLLAYFQDHEPGMLDRVMVCPGDPSTELLAACFMAKAQAFLDDEGMDLICRQVEIEETPTNTVVFNGPAAAVLPARPEGAGRGTPWWWRADASINDLESMTWNQ